MTTVARGVATVTTTKVAVLLVKWGRGVCRALMRSAIYNLAPTRDVVLLKVMNDHDLVRWASQPAKQRRYALRRRRWAVKTGRPILTEAHMRGRPK